MKPGAAAFGDVRLLVASPTRPGRDTPARSGSTVLASDLGTFAEEIAACGQRTAPREFPRLGGEPSRLADEPPRLGGEPPRLGGELPRLGGELTRLGGEPSRLGGESSRFVGERPDAPEACSTQGGLSIAESLAALAALNTIGAEVAMETGAAAAGGGAPPTDVEAGPAKDPAAALRIRIGKRNQDGAPAPEMPAPEMPASAIAASAQAGRVQPEVERAPQTTAPVAPRDRSGEPEVAPTTTGDATGASVARQIGDAIQATVRNVAAATPQASVVQASIAQGDGASVIARADSGRPVSTVVRTVVLRLEPEALGSVRLSIRMGGDSLRVVIDAERADAVHALRAAHEHLTGILAAATPAAAEVHVRDATNGATWGTPPESANPAALLAGEAGPSPDGAPSERDGRSRGRSDRGENRHGRSDEAPRNNADGAGRARHGLIL